jgi:hypothetical protein
MDTYVHNTDVISVYILTKGSFSPSKFTALARSTDSLYM